MPPSVSRSLDPEAMRASWSSWFSIKSAHLVPKCVRSYELSNIREWYAASETSSQASAASFESGSPARGAESLLMAGRMDSYNGSEVTSNPTFEISDGVAAIVADEGQQVYAMVHHDGVCSTQASPPLSAEDSDGASSQHSSCSAHSSKLSSPSLPVPNPDVCRLPLFRAGANTTFTNPIADTAITSATAAPGGTGKTRRQHAFLCQSVTAGPASAAAPAGALTASPAQMLPQIPLVAPQQRVCVALVPGGKGSVELQVTYKPSTRTAQILAALHASSQKQAIASTSAAQHQPQKQPVQQKATSGPSSARSAQILAGLRASAAASSSKDQTPRKSTAALPAERDASSMDDDTLDVHRDASDQRTSLHKTKKTSSNGGTDQTGPLNLKDLLGSTSKEAPRPSSYENDVKGSCFAAPSAPALAARPEQQRVEVCMVAATHMTGPGIQSGRDTALKKDTGHRAHKTSNISVVTLKQSGSMLKETWGSADVSDDDTRQQQQQHPSLEKRRQQQQRRLHDTRDTHHTSQKQQQPHQSGIQEAERAVQLQSTKQAVPPKQEDAKQRPAESRKQRFTRLPLSHKQGHKQGQVDLQNLPARASKRPVPPLRLDAMGAEDECGMPALNTSESPVVSERAPRSSRAGVVSPYQKRMVEASFGAAKSASPSVAKTEGGKAPHAVTPAAPAMLAGDQNVRAAKKACHTMSKLVTKLVPDFQGPALGASISSSGDSNAWATRLKGAAQSGASPANGSCAPTLAAAAPEPSVARTLSSLSPLNLAQLSPRHLSPRMFAQDGAQPAGAVAAPNEPCGEARGQFGSTFGSPVEGEVVAAPWEASGPESCKAREAQDQGRSAGGQLGGAYGPQGSYAALAAVTGVVPDEPAEGEGLQDGAQLPGLPLAAGSSDCAQRAAAGAPAVRECTAEWVGPDNDGNAATEDEVHVNVVERIMSGKAVEQAAKEGQAAAAKKAPAAATDCGPERVAVVQPAQQTTKKPSQSWGFCACFAPKVQD